MGDVVSDRAPQHGTRRYIKVLEAGCGGYRDYWGEFDCRHNYPWTCDDCPIVVEQYRPNDQQEMVKLDGN
jgi:hypothetical protein